MERACTLSRDEFVAMTQRNLDILRDEFLVIRDEDLSDRWENEFFEHGGSNAKLSKVVKSY